MSKNYLERYFPTPGATAYPTEASLSSLSLAAPVIRKCKSLFGDDLKLQKLTVENNQTQSP